MSQNYPKKQSRKSKRQEKELEKANSTQRQRQRNFSVCELYELRFDKKALNFINKLDKKTKQRIWSKLQECKIDPFRFLKPLVQINGFKLRVGDYRIIIDVQEKIKILYIEKIGHRKNIYER